MECGRAVSLNPRPGSGAFAEFAGAYGERGSGEINVIRLEG